MTDILDQLRLQAGRVESEKLLRKAFESKIIWSALEEIKRLRCLNAILETEVEKGYLSTVQGDKK